MELKELFHKQIAFFEQDLNTKDEVIEFLTSKLKSQKFIKDEKDFKDAVYKREGEGSTGIGDGIAIPHVLNPTVEKSAIAFVKLKNKIDWQSLDDQPVDLVFMIMTNGKDGNEHLDALASLSGYLIKQEVQAGLRSAKSVDTVKTLFSQPKEKKDNAPKNGKYDVIGITACPTGIAHTYLAAEKLQEYGEQQGLSVKIETQGRRGVENKLTADDIANAKVIILAHDKAIQGMARFNGYKVIDTTTKEAIYKGKDLIVGFDNHPKVQKVENAKDDEDSGSGELTLKQFKKVKDNLLAGVSRMLPFVVAGGIILGFGFLLDYIYTASLGITAIADENKFKQLFDGKVFDDFKNAVGFWTASDGAKYYYSGSFGSVWGVAQAVTAVGKIGMELMIPILAAYVCYSLVGAQGLMVGAVAGLISNGDGFVYGTVKSWGGGWSRFLPEAITKVPSSGFIGALIGAYLGGLAVFGLAKMMKNLPKGLQGARDIVFVPVLSLAAIALIMLAINIPLGYVMLGLQEGIVFLADKNLLFIVCTLIGFMMCVDMGGPINKIAYSLGVLAVGNQLVKDPNSAAYSSQTMIMTASLVGGMVPPIGIAISTVLFPRQWSAKHKDSAKANWLMGVCFISEGAIPFMIEDPKRISVSAMVGGAIAGAIAGAMQITITAPHGGIFISPLTNSLVFNDVALSKGLGIAFFITAFMVGSIIMGIILGFWRMADIKNGKLVLSGTNGVRESIQNRISKYTGNDKKIAVLESKLNKYNQFEENLKIKQNEYQKQLAEKQKSKAK